MEIQAELKERFGNSKVLDDSGNPLLVYHGTTAVFSEFSLEKKGSNTGWSNTVHGFFFIADQKLAEDFARDNNAGGDVVIKKAYLSMQKPMDIRIGSIFKNKEQAPDLVEYITWGEEILESAEALDWLDDNIGLGELSDMRDTFETQEFNDFLTSKGYDGIISNFGNNKAEYVVFQPSQIIPAGDVEISNTVSVESEKTKSPRP